MLDFVFIYVKCTVYVMQKLYVQKIYKYFVRVFTTMDEIINYKLLKRMFLVKICLEDGMFLWTTISLNFLP